METVTRIQVIKAGACSAQDISGCLPIARFVTLLLSALSFTACTVGPDYVKPETPQPTGYMYEDPTGQSVPMEAAWWRAYDDAQLDALVATATADSPNLAAALARVDRAAAAVGIARADLFPQVDFFTSGVRERTSGNTGNTNNSGGTRNRLSSSLGLEWEIDIWGRVRRLSDSALAEAQAEADAFVYAQTLLQTSVAESYFRIRVIDRSIGILERTIRGRYELMQLADLRMRSGLGDDLELAQSRTEWATAAAELEAYRRQRAVAQNALAVLVGTLPEGFIIQPDPDWEIFLPRSPTVIPSELLERRPDISEAEQLVKAASERIGARTAEYFPSIRINGDVGFAASDASNWFTRSSLFGSFGPAIELPLLTGDRTKSRVEQAKADFRELTALYKQQVLDAFRQVEDALAGLQFLSREIDRQGIAARAANNAAVLARQRFDSGLVSYLEVVDTERIALTTNLRLSQLEGEILTSQLALIRSLGGGWQGPGQGLDFQDTYDMAEDTTDQTSL